MSDWRNRLKLKERSGRFHHFFHFSGLHLHPRRHCEKLPPAKDEKISAFVWKRLQHRADCFKEVLEGVCVFDVHILPPAEPRMNNDPAHIWLRDRASGPWAACSRPTDDWWPAGEQKHVQLTNQNRLSIKRNDSPFILQPNLCSKIA